MPLPLFSIRKPRWTLLLAFLIYFILVVLNFSKDFNDDQALESIHRNLQRETLNFLSFIPEIQGSQVTAVRLQDTRSCVAQGRTSNVTCSLYYPPIDIIPDAVTRICDTLAGKRIVFVGPLTTYHLHNLWLEALEAHEGHSLNCPGPEFCIFHHICYPRRNGTYLDIDKQRFPKNQELRDTNSAILQYVLSSSLVANRDKNSYLYARPVMDPRTNIRMRNYYWLRKAQKANILVLSHAPVPAPPATYAQFFEGKHATTGSIWSNPWKSHLLQAELVSLAFNATISVFLPSLRAALTTMQNDNQIRSTLKIWHGHWALDPECTNLGLPQHVPRLGQFWTADRHHVDPWTFYFNLQGTEYAWFEHRKLITSIQFTCRTE